MGVWVDFERARFSTFLYLLGGGRGLGVAPINLLPHSGDVQSHFEPKQQDNRNLFYCRGIRNRRFELHQASLKCLRLFENPLTSSVSNSKSTIYTTAKNTL